MSNMSFYSLWVRMFRYPLVKEATFLVLGYFLKKYLWTTIVPSIRRCRRLRAKSNRLFEQAQLPGGVWHRNEFFWSVDTLKEALVRLEGSKACYRSLWVWYYYAKKACIRSSFPQKEMWLEGAA